ncbi:galactose mutarotase-like protein [Phanerochaete sordida]|uniref:Galactose mutarotase-like protein n=1 Tax=Phanerochaete sordida TaxID=48140 RepID=A0A9P3G965_9APHY|nr:galactose mutarotase-like protein [Phanerochaete sordida]
MTTDPRFTPVLLTLPSLTPSLALEVLPHGVTFHRLYVQADGKTHDILVGPEDPATHLQQKYTNSLVGRYANRVPVAPAALAKGPAQGALAPRPNEKPTVSLHGGVQGFDAHVWEPLLDPSEAQLFTPAERATIQADFPGQAGVVFARTSDDGEEGYPGRLRVEVFVGLAGPRGKAIDEATGEYCLGSLVVVYRAKLEDADKVTPINLTQHWGFNLDASLQDGSAPSVHGHKLKIKAKHTIELDPATALSTGRLAPVAGTHHDHAAKAAGTIGEQFEQGYDEFYVFDRPAHPVATRLPAEAEDANVLNDVLSQSPARAAADPLVLLASDKSGLKVVFESNQSGVQFYTNNLTSPAKNARKRIHGGSGEFGKDGYDVGSAAFLEFHEPLAAFLAENAGTRGASGDDTLLAPGELYNNFVRADVWYRAPEGGAAE